MPFCKQKVGILDINNTKIVNIETLFKKQDLNLIKCEISYIFKQCKLRSYYLSKKVHCFVGAEMWGRSETFVLVLYSK